MAKLEDVILDPNYIQVHNAGFVGLVDHMGSDDSVVQAARISYAGTEVKRIKEDRALIRYLLKHDHGTPFEMTAIKFHIKMPIFVMRQWVRHRIGFSINEYSGRYSEMVDDFYIPEVEYIQPQSLANKQGRSGEMSQTNKNMAQSWIVTAYQQAYKWYRQLLDPGVEDTTYPGVSKELSRIVLPVGNYTELYWQGNLRSLFHFLVLRLDPHAQKEIRDFAEAIYKLIQPLYPVSCEAFEDYMRQAKKISRMEIELLKSMFDSHLYELVQSGCLKEKAQSLGMSTREIDEFISFWNID